MNNVFVQCEVASHLWQNLYRLWGDLGVTSSALSAKTFLVLVKGRRPKGFGAAVCWLYGGRIFNVYLGAGMEELWA